jgi:N6-L-threonylcarbamoyladenine synthase
MKYIDAVAVTQGPGLAVALEVGIQKAKEIASEYKKPLIAVNHLEGHIYSCFAQNQKGNPKTRVKFPYLALVVSGGHTELVLLKDHLKYEVLGETVDDAAGEALDKAAKLLGFGYPGGPVIERLAANVQNKDMYKLPRPMKKSGDLNFSFSGLKTAFYYLLKEMNEKEKNKNVKLLASSFQEAVFESLLFKTERAIQKTGVMKLLDGGGVVANKHLRNHMRRLVKKYNGEVLFPPYQYLSGDNAAMIGIVASYKADKKQFVTDFEKLDRIPRFSLSQTLRS